MVTYEYKCTVCGAWSDLRCRLGKAPSVTPCITCGEKAKRGFHTAPHVHLKGWDWHGKDLWDPMDPRNDNPLDFRGIEPPTKTKIFT